MQARVRFVPVAGNPHAEIVRDECAKCRRECDLALSGATLCGDRARRAREMQARVRFGFVRRNPMRRSCVSRSRNAGESAICPGRGQASAERVERAKCRRECDLSRSGTTGPLRRSCVSSARNAGESAICPGRGQPSAGIVRVECAKCRRECDLSRSRAILGIARCWVAVKGDCFSPSFSTQQTEPASLSGQLNL